MKNHVKALGVVIVVMTLGLIAWQYFADRSRGNPEIERQMVHLPSIQLKTIDGKDVNTVDARGRVTIVNFWASWCAPCVEEVPSLAKLSEKMGDDLRILAISGDADVEDIRVFLKSFPAFQRSGIDIIFDEGLKVSKIFDVVRLPESYIYDGQGRMARKIAGSIDWSTEDAITYLKALKK